MSDSSEGSNTRTSDDGHVPASEPTDDEQPVRAESADERDVDDEWDDPPTYDSSGSGMRGRDVEVPMRIYKTVTVFSTLIAVVLVVAGFVLLDQATARAQLPLSEIDPVLALLGIATILFGAAIYAFSARFRAAGMGTSKTDDDESDDNG